MAVFARICQLKGVSWKTVGGVVGWREYGREGVAEFSEACAKEGPPQGKRDVKGARKGGCNDPVLLPIGVAFETPVLTHARLFTFPGVGYESGGVHPSCSRVKELFLRCDAARKCTNYIPFPI